MRILIYGAGVIGSLYAALFAEAGYDTNIYARGKRLEALRNNGLQYKKNQEVIKAEVRILGELPNDDIYDFVLLTVRENQLYEALTELKNNKSNTIVTVINSLDSYNKWEDIVGKGRILPAFPGAGGSINDDGILDAALTPRLIQPTTFAEISGNKSERTKEDIDVILSGKVSLKVKMTILIIEILIIGLYGVVVGAKNMGAIRNDAIASMEEYVSEEHPEYSQEEIQQELQPILQKMQQEKKAKQDQFFYFMVIMCILTDIWVLYLTFDITSGVKRSALLSLIHI